MKWLVAFLLAGPASAQIYAIPTAYCGGRLVAEIFDTQVVPGPQGRASYLTRIYNTGTTAMRVQVQVVGDVLGRPTGQIALAARQRLPVNLGYSMNLPGRVPLRGEVLVNATRISCL